MLHVSFLELLVIAVILRVLCSARAPARFIRTVGLMIWSHETRLSGDVRAQVERESARTRFVSSCTTKKDQWARLKKKAPKNLRTISSAKAASNVKRNSQCQRHTADQTIACRA